jgi:hypothetical protein
MRGEQLGRIVVAESDRVEYVDVLGKNPDIRELDVGGNSCGARAVPRGLEDFFTGTWSRSVLVELEAQRIAAGIEGGQQYGRTGRRCASRPQLDCARQSTNETRPRRVAHLRACTICFEAIRTRLRRKRARKPCRARAAICVGKPIEGDAARVGREIAGRIAPRSIERRQFLITDGCVVTVDPRHVRHHDHAQPASARMRIERGLDAHGQEDTYGRSHDDTHACGWRRSAAPKGEQFAPWDGPAALMARHRETDRRETTRASAGRTRRGPHCRRRRRPMP